MLVLALVLLVATTLIYAAFFGGPTKTPGSSESPSIGANGSPQLGASGSTSMGDAAYASSWTAHPLSTLDGEGDLQKSGFKRPKWGSFRPGIYFGMKDASTPSQEIPASPVTGILWGTQNSKHKGLRHQTQQDELKSFDWMEHDGRSYGKERMVDRTLELEVNASFVIPKEIGGKNSDNVIWAQRILVSPLNDGNLDKASLQFYMTSECTSSLPTQLRVAQKALNIEKVVESDEKHKDGRKELVVVGSSERFGKFSLALTLTSPGAGSLTYYGASAKDMASGVEALQTEYRHHRPVPNEANEAKGAVAGAVYATGEGGGSELSNYLPSAEEGGASFIAVQATGALEHDQGQGKRRGFVVDAVLYSHEDEAATEDICKLHSSSKQQTLADSDALSGWLQEASAKFEERFESTFRLSDKVFQVVSGQGGYTTTNEPEFSAADKGAAKVALSSMLGGIGYFYGTPRIGNAIDVDNDEMGTSAGGQRSRKDRGVDRELFPEDWDPISLLTATPSRTSFPRGFLWDEGFHEMLISQWDDELSLTIISDWMKAMYAYKEGAAEDEDRNEGEEEMWGGWIPREMILGEDASKRVPDEFITQRVNIANPPTLLLVLDRITRKYSGVGTGGEPAESAAKVQRVKTLLHDMYPLLQLWVQWFLRSQRGGSLPAEATASDDGPSADHAPEISGFRWRGRSLSDVAGGKVMPNTLASGLDDYPRAPIPSDYERHVDLHCWMVMAVSLVESMGALLGQEGTPAHAKFSQLHQDLLPMLDSVHWFEGAFPVTEGDATGDTDYADEEEGASSRADGEVDGDDEKKVKASAEAGSGSSRREKRGLYADTGLQGVAGDEIITGVSIRCGQVKDRTTIETVAPIGAVVEMQKYLQMVKLQQQYAEKKKTDPALATEPPPVLPEAPPAVCPASHPQYIQAIPNSQGQAQTREMYVVGGSSGNRELSLQMIPRVGYVNIFPLLLKLLPVPGPGSRAQDRAKFDSLLDLIESPDLLWSSHGLRSIAKQDAFYQRRNSPGDAPYWRGPIWINMNYLALGALHYYVEAGEAAADAASTQPPPSIKRAERLYHELRRNVLSTVLGEYHRTGFFWEQYDDRSGNGIMGHPFSGWTALVVNIMAEIYE